MNLILRNFWYILRKFKSTSIMVVLGLTAAFTVFLVVVMQCYYDFSYNGSFKITDDLYMYVIDDESGGYHHIFSNVNSPNEMQHEMR